MDIEKEVNDLKTRMDALAAMFTLTALAIQTLNARMTTMDAKLDTILQRLPPVH